jgi:acetoin utilization deacetylase AcuC-like enzyme
MNSIQKAATAFMALTITLVGATLATAPLALADIRPAVHHAMSSVAQAPTVAVRCQSLRRS